jgi:hypothetical protein
LAGSVRPSLVSGWPTVLISLGSLVVGAILTMLGQTLADRRTRSREREARREDFLIRNFDTQREALLKVQELVDEIARSVRAEHRRKLDDGVYAYFESKPARNISSAKLGLLTQLQALQELTDRHEGPWSENEKEELNREMMQIMKDMPAMARRISDGMQTMFDYALSDERQKFLRNFASLIQSLTLNMYRTGSGAVTSAVHDYQDAAIEYSGRLVMANFEQYQANEQRARTRLHESIGRELKRGPF